MQRLNHSKKIIKQISNVEEQRKVCGWTEEKRKIKSENQTKEWIWKRKFPNRFYRSRIFFVFFPFVLLFIVSIVKATAYYSWIIIIFMYVTFTFPSNIVIMVIVIVHFFVFLLLLSLVEIRLTKILIKKFEIDPW